MSLDGHYTFRQELADELVRDFAGPPTNEVPRPDEEFLTEDPITRYQVGVLYPPSADLINPVEDVGVPEGRGDDVAEDEPVALASVRYPSSAGITFALDESVASVLVTASVVAFEALDTTRPDVPVGATWRRVPIICDPHPLDVSGAGSGQRSLVEGLELFWRVRPVRDGARSVTVGLLNAHVVPAGQYGRDAQSWFHPTLVVSGSETSPFVARPGGEELGLTDEDLSSYRLLYRHALDFATGHGCSADWDLSEDSSRATAVWITFAPRYDLRLADSNPTIRSQWFGLRELADSDRSEVLSGLGAFVSEYEAWIDSRRGDLDDGLNLGLRATGERHLAACEEAARRMHRGLAVLDADPKAWKAFVTMNQAMLVQRARSDWLKDEHRGPAPDLDGSHAWRPFQIAFILQAIEGLANPTAGDRDLVDLLWFPTGGGKTEAYLGLIAFTVVLRRLRNRGGGVTAIMRYTLRLLTIQQFERAATLMCALEVLRRNDLELGEAPISIGLWVGGDATPLKRRDATKALDKIRQGVPVEKGNPIQLHKCPWCGTPLDHTNYWMARNDPRLVIACKTSSCEFSAGLPAWIIDEDVYDRRPTLLIGTADKFASLPWRDNAAKIFNLRTGDPPPELIIQDELHLISGPLGTLTGLYETAVDALCDDNGVRPKVVASTATIRRAQDQVSALFARDVRQFPAPGLDARDNWFSVEADPQEKGTRLYLGLMAPGRSQTTLLVRSYSALLQAGANIEGDENTRDAYWTLLGYFNSLRVLGGARMQVSDDVPDRIDVLAGRFGDPPRVLDRVIELTSRAASSDVPGFLRDMSRTHLDQYRLDAVLATNMISVGVDVDRLSLMVVMGQPQSASEYIQATSRVGRRWPGLVVVLLNAARSRDRSHYESFRSFHAGIYRQVESSSVTPFSPRALDRALHAVLVGLTRLLLPQFSENAGAARIGTNAQDLEPVLDIIRRRVRAVAPEQETAVEASMQRIVSEWADIASEVELVYHDRQRPDRSLLVDATDHDTQPEGHFRTLWSLRDVDTESNLFLVRD